MHDIYVDSDTGEKLLLSALEDLQVVYEELLPPSRMGRARLCRF